MDETTLGVLLTTAATVAVLHTAIGVDHSLPFVVIGRARGWSLARTLSITAVCGIGHILSSVLIGSIGIGLGIAFDQLEWVEGTRGSLAAWLLIGFGLAYAVWGIRRAWLGRKHEHVHVHEDAVHTHPHDHSGPHAHPHGSTASITTWSLFVIFVLGPCEALIPLLTAPAAAGERGSIALVCAVFGVATLATMLVLVTLGYLGVQFVSTKWLERWSHALAGGAIAGSGLAIQVLGI